MEGVERRSSEPVPLLDLSAGRRAERGQARRREMREVGELVQLRAGVDEDLHFTAQELSRLRGPEPVSDDPMRRRVLPDPGAEISRMQVMRAVIHQLLRRGQVEPRSWFCNMCYYSNPPTMRRCRGYLDPDHSRIGEEVRWMRDRRQRRNCRLRLSCAGLYGRGAETLANDMT